MLFRIVALATTLGLACGQPPATPDDADIKALLAKVEAAARDKRFDEALVDVDRAIALSKDRNPALLKKAYFVSAKTLHMYAEKDPSKATQLASKAMEHYRRSVLNASLSSDPVAAHNIAVLSILSGDPKSAVEIMKGLKFETLPDAHLYHQTYARALEGVGSRTEAFREYAASVRHQPDSDYSAQAAFRLATSSPSKSLELCANLIETLLVKGRTSLAGQQFVEALSIWPGDRESIRLLPYVIWYCGDAALTQKGFDEGKDPVLLAAAKIASFRSALSRIRSVYTEGFFREERSPIFRQGPDDHAGRLQAMLTFFPAPEGFKPISSNPLGRDPWRQAHSAFLKAVGDQYLSQARRKSNDSAKFATEAAMRYGAAWILDPRNLEAALYLVESLKRDSLWNPAESEAIRHQFVEVLFSAKGGIYTEDPKNLAKEEYTNLYFLHWLLASIFETERPTAPKGDPRSPAFQYDRALRIWKLVSDRYKETLPGEKLVREGFERFSNR